MCMCPFTKRNGIVFEMDVDGKMKLCVWDKEEEEKEE